MGTPLEKLHWMTEQILKGLTNEEHTLLFLIMIQASTSDAIPDEVKDFLNEEEFVSPVACILPLIVAGQEAGDINGDAPITLAITYYTCYYLLCFYTRISDK